MPGYRGITQAFKKRVTEFVNSDFFDNFIILMVILNTVSLGMMNLVHGEVNDMRLEANKIFTYIFIVEMILKLYVMGVRNYVRDPMCLFDGIIVLTSTIELFGLDDAASGNDNKDDSTTNADGTTAEAPA